jgi:HlyD family secretion protein
MNRWIKRSIGIAAGLLGLAAVAYSYVPKPAPVEIETASRGPLLVEVEADGQTRVKRRYVVQAPLGGVVSRPELRAGDAVKAGDPLVSLAPIEPPLLDARSRAQAEAQARAATAARAQAEAQVDLARTALAFARTDLDRERKLAEAGTTSPATLEAAELKHRTAEQQLAAARMGVQTARFNEEAAAAALLRASGKKTGDAGVSLRSPADGRVLRVLLQDGGVVAAGTPIFEVGDPTDLEIVVDLLSTDAVNVRPGAAVSVIRWGGRGLLPAAVRTVEPAGFTKVSALGVEEQRVNVIADFTGEPAARAPLGDGYRVEARVTVEHLPDVLRVPLAALFRSGDDWAAYVVRGDGAVLTRLRLGQRNERWAEVLGGLEEGARIVLHPGDRLKDGARVTPKPAPQKAETARIAGP